MTDTYTFTGLHQPWIRKDPQAILDYTFDWTDWLAGVADTIASMTVTGNGVTIDSAVQAGALVTVWVSGGTAGATASVTLRIVTDGARSEDRTIWLGIGDR